MKMVKSLLLGTAAGLVAMTGAQAADLPVKAKPVQYVKICSLYGAGFFYIPGTDTCLKIGGYARAEWLWNAGGSFNPQTGGTTAGLENRAQNQLNTRNRFLATFDVRSQTEFGTLRAYTRVGWQWTTNDGITGGSGAVTYLDRAFIQLGGWTFGKTESFFNFTLADFGYSNQTQLLFNDTGGSGVPVLAYTAQFGNGLSATLSVEDHNENEGPVAAVTVGTLAGAVPPAALGAGTGGVHAPDLVANLRVDQAWGSAQIEGALVNITPAYYTAGLGVPPVGSIAHADDKVGGAIGAGIKINLPMLGAGDSVGVAGAYCSGASHYCSNNGNPLTNALFGLTQGGTTGLGMLWDGFYNNTGTAAQPLGSLELSRTWNVNGGIEHRWNPMWKTSLWGAYLNYKANSPTIDASCALTPIFATAAFQGAGCLDFTAWQIGSRTVWNPVVNLDVSVEVMYSAINNTALSGTAILPVATGQVATIGGDLGVWSGVLRFQRNFWP
jgi:hypothetical protein